MKIKPFQAVYPNIKLIASPDTFFGTVKEEYTEYVKSGFFNKTAQESIYIYQITTPERTYTGLIACADINEYFDGKIKKHENTLAAKEQNQMHLMLMRNAMVKPILLTYKPVVEINKLINKYIKKNESFLETFFEISQQTHTFWEVSDGVQIQKFQDLFKKHISYTYIADGHHRCSTLGLMHNRITGSDEKRDFSQLLSVFFPADQLEIHDYNRVIEGLNDLTISRFIVHISQIFDIEIIDGPMRPERKHDLILFINKEWYKLRWKDKVLKEYKKRKVILDANMLDEKVLHDILGIKDVTTDNRVKYVEGPKGIAGFRTQAIKNENRLGFLLFPVELKDLMKVADAGKVMPPKSTWFEPRIKNGLIVQEF